MKRVIGFGFRLLKEFFLNVLGIFVAAFGLKGFLIPSGFIDGGITGISLLVSVLSGVSISIIIFVLNICFYDNTNRGFFMRPKFRMKGLFYVQYTAVFFH